MAILRDKDGNTDIIYDNMDFYEVLDNRLGSEYAEYFKGVCDKVDYNKMKLNSDLESYESQLESNCSEINDVLDIIEDINSILCSKRLNKEKLYKYIVTIETKLSNMI